MQYLLKERFQPKVNWNNPVGKGGDTHRKLVKHNSVPGHGRAGGHGRCALIKIMAQKALSTPARATGFLASLHDSKSLTNARICFRSSLLTSRRKSISRARKHVRCMASRSDAARCLQQTYVRACASAPIPFSKPLSPYPQPPHFSPSPSLHTPPFFLIPYNIHICKRTLDFSAFCSEVDDGTSGNGEWHICTTGILREDQYRNRLIGKADTNAPADAADEEHADVSRSCQEARAHQKGTAPKHHHNAPPQPGCNERRNNACTPSRLG